MKIGKIGKFSGDAIVSGTARFWTHHYRKALMLVFLGVSAAAAYFWYQVFYQSEWSAEERNEYANAQHQEINLDEEQYSQMLKIIEERKSRLKNVTVPGRDIFMFAESEEF